MAEYKLIDFMKEPGMFWCANEFLMVNYPDCALRPMESIDKSCFRLDAFKKMYYSRNFADNAKFNPNCEYVTDDGYGNYVSVGEIDKYKYIAMWIGPEFFEDWIPNNYDCSQLSTDGLIYLCSVEDCRDESVIWELFNRDGKDIENVDDLLDDPDFDEVLAEVIESLKEDEDNE